MAIDETNVVEFPTGNPIEITHEETSVTEGEYLPEPGDTLGNDMLTNTEPTAL